MERNHRGARFPFPSLRFWGAQNAAEPQDKLLQWGMLSFLKGEVGKWHRLPTSCTLRGYEGCWQPLLWAEGVPALGGLEGPAVLLLVPSVLAGGPGPWTEARQPRWA